MDETRVLVVEDDKSNQIVFSTLLKNMGLDFDLAETGRQAVQAVRERTYSIILMDIRMPELDGLEATKTIRSLGSVNGKQIPIVAVTAQAMDGDKERCIWAGMSDYLSKPFTREELEKTIRHWLGPSEP
ncbi:MAG: response regulator [Candidatus Obscuribacterales bacterium]|nr:response regulator [Cyanobacteria bacterium SZAS LIN-5]RTL40660.1 MAG: response regulator [Candidatus Melainabacteria bacterium]